MSIKVKVKLNRIVRRDNKGFVIENEARPYQFEIQIGKMPMFSAWFCGADEKSEQLINELAQILSDAKDIDVEID